MELQIAGPYNYVRVLERLSHDPLNQIDLEAKRLKVPLNIYGDDVVAVVMFRGSAETATCQIQLPANYEEEGIRKITNIFQLETSLQEVNDHFLETDLAPLFKKFSGMPLICDFNLYFCIIKTIIHQQLNIRFAYTLTERFLKKFGKEKDGVYFNPTPETVSQLKYQDLRELSFSQRKAEYVIDTSRLIVSGELDLEALSLCSDEEVIESLVKIRGIGYWTAENILLFGLGRKNLFPVKDVGIQNAVKNLYNLDEKPSIEEMLTVSESWSPYKSYASLYLWESLDNQKVRS